MKKYLIIPISFICTACFPEPVPGPTLLEQLNTNPDPIFILEIYDKVYSKCDGHMESAYSCLQERELAEPGTMFRCTATSDSYTKTYDNTSDECILYRRSPTYHESQVKYFDYKRFLGQNSPIKTDDEFLKLVERYKNISECDDMQEVTTTEKEACKEKRKNEIRELAKRKVPCSELINEQYTEYLKKQGNWFNWAIDHDPYEIAKEAEYYRSQGFYDLAYQLSFVSSPTPVWSRSKARKSVENDIKNFGVKNFCTVDDWKQKIKKLGFNI